MLMSSFSRGFTLIELLVTLTIMAIVLAIGMPMMGSVVERNTISGQVNSLVGAANLARSEAIKRSVAVVICRSDNPSADAPSCAASGTDWKSGWIVFVDRDANGQMNSASSDSDVLLRIQEAMSDTGGITQNTFTKLIFRPTGLMSSGASQFTFQSRSLNSEQQRRVCVTLSGRTRLIDNSTDTCSD